MTSEIFEYKKGNKVKEIIAIASISVILVFLPISTRDEIIPLFLSVLCVAFLIFIISYTYLLNENIEMNAESIIINKKIGKSIQIPFNRIRRVTIREEDNSISNNHLVMTIFEINDNKKIPISELDNQQKLIELIAQKGTELGFKIIKQDLSGKVLNR